MNGWQGTKVASEGVGAGKVEGRDERVRKRGNKDEVCDRRQSRGADWWQERANEERVEEREESGGEEIQIRRRGETEKGNKVEKGTAVRIRR